jgi:hypothetical protein
VSVYAFLECISEVAAQDGRRHLGDVAGVHEGRLASAAGTLIFGRLDAGHQTVWSSA